MNREIVFKDILPRCGGQRNAFEELCCKIFWLSLTPEEQKTYIRFRGDGGDGGVECIATVAGKVTGIQVKYLFSYKSLVAQAKVSFKAAIANHPELDSFILCFPFDLTGPTGRGKGESDSFDSWKKEMEELALSSGCNACIVPCSGSVLQTKLLQYDRSRGLSSYFFDQRFCTESWFSSQVDRATSSAGKRYNTFFQVKTGIVDVLHSFSQEACWKEKLLGKQTELANKNKVFKRFLTKPKQNDDCLYKTVENDKTLISATEEIDNLCGKDLLATDYDSMIGLLGKVLFDSKTILSDSAEVFEQKNGKGTAFSEPFKQYSAEMLCSFPMEHLERLKEWLDGVETFSSWLSSDEGKAFYFPVMMLLGIAGSGKTNALVEETRVLIGEDRPACLLLGSSFSNCQGTILRTFCGLLDIPSDVPVDTFLDNLDYQGEFLGHPVVIFIDAINETEPLALRFWSQQLPVLCGEIEKRPHLRLCVSCRTEYKDFCIPEPFPYPQVTCMGFQGISENALSQFFSHYGLTLPLFPLLQSEYDNPLYVRLLCETLQKTGQNTLPLSWYGVSMVFKGYLQSKDAEFNRSHGIFGSPRYVTSVLFAIAKRMLVCNSRRIQRKHVLEIIQKEQQEVSCGIMTNWLLQEGLLLDGIDEDGESYCSFSFERLGDYLLASSLIEDSTTCDEVAGLFSPDGPASLLLRSEESVKEFKGLLLMLSEIIPERFPGVEFPFIVSVPVGIKNELICIAFEGLRSRMPDSFTGKTSDLLSAVCSCKVTYDYFYDHMLPIMLQPSLVDAFYLERFLTRFSMAKRDSNWCPYVHFSYEKKGIVYRLIHHGLEVEQTYDDEIAFRYALVLAWFTAASDRRVKDYSTRALVRLFLSNPSVRFSLLFQIERDWNDDDEVLYRTLLAVYGASLIKMQKEQLSLLVKSFSTWLLDRYEGQFENAAIRDMMQGIVTLQLQVDPSSSCPDIGLPLAKDDTWTASIGTDEEVIMKLGETISFLPDDFYSDFYKYTIPHCIREREGQDFLTKKQAGSWIVQRIAKIFGYPDAKCEQFDKYLMSIYGNGRSRKKWAERIGKKYQWIALNQLASRWIDHDNRNKPKEDRLLTNYANRNIDPTLLCFITVEEGVDPWWIPHPYVMNMNLSDNNWQLTVSDIPEFPTLVETVSDSTTKWIPGYYFMNKNSMDHTAESYDKAYRDMWMFVWGYLVVDSDFEKTIEFLKDKNFEGRWMPEETGTKVGVFAGEYGNMIDNGEHEQDDSLPASVYPVWNEINTEWEYDATGRFDNSGIVVPAHRLFSPDEIVWDGKGTWVSKENGIPLFQDPSVRTAGPRTLLMNSEVLQEWLTKNHYRLFWTLLGEKSMVNTPVTSKPFRCGFSQIAWLNPDGTVSSGERTFYVNDIECSVKNGKIQRRKVKKV